MLFCILFIIFLSFNNPSNSLASSFSFSIRRPNSFSEIRQLNNDKTHNTRFIVFKHINQIASEYSESPDSPKKG